MKVQTIKERISSLAGFINTLQTAHVLLPDGIALTIDRGTPTNKYCIMRHDYIDKYAANWTPIYLVDTLQHAIQYYNGMFKPAGSYYCIAEILEPRLHDNVMLNKWFAPMPTIKGYIADRKTISMHLCAYVNRNLANYSEGGPLPTEITQSLSNAFVHSKQFIRKYYNDCVVVKNGSYQNGYGFTYQYGKYYFIGFLNNEEAENYRFPHKLEKEKIEKEEWVKIDLNGAVVNFNKRRTIKSFNRYANTERIFDNHTIGFWDSKQLSFSELFTSDWYVKED